MSCGLFSNIDRFQFVGDIRLVVLKHVIFVCYHLMHLRIPIIHSNSPDDTQQLLSSVGLWESHGKHFINGGIEKEGNKKLHMCSLKSHAYNHTHHVGFQQRDERQNASAANTAYGHSKNSKSKLEKYYTPELLKVVREELYADDYKVYKLVNEEKLRNGKQLAMELTKSTC